MNKYICPECNAEMLFVDDTKIYKCNIRYFDYIENSPSNCLFKVNGITLANGTFEHCCRVYKLKAFS